MSFGALGFSADFLSAATFGLRPFLLRGALGFLSFESGRSSMVVLGWVSGLALSIGFWILKFYLKDNISTINDFDYMWSQVYNKSARIITNESSRKITSQSPNPTHAPLTPVKKPGIKTPMEPIFPLRRNRAQLRMVIFHDPFKILDRRILPPNHPIHPLRLHSGAAFNNPPILPQHKTAFIQTANRHIPNPKTPNLLFPLITSFLSFPQPNPNLRIPNQLPKDHNVSGPSAYPRFYIKLGFFHFFKIYFLLWNQRSDPLCYRATDP
jgi:hypothetical protein